MTTKTLTLRNAIKACGFTIKKWSNGYNYRSVFASKDGKHYECYYSGSGEFYYLLGDDGFESDSFLPEPYTEEDFIKSAKECVEKEK